jgi:hypothetical protein
MDRLVARDAALVNTLVASLRDGTRLVIRIRRNPSARRYRVWGVEDHLLFAPWSTVVWFSDRDPRP